jgi:hypothetical protein
MSTDDSEVRAASIIRAMSALMMEAACYKPFNCGKFSGLLEINLANAANGFLLRHV